GTGLRWCSTSWRRAGFCFFFQAEDGIRDFHVTGVQTCALPIYRRRRRAAHLLPDRAADAQAGAGDAGGIHLHGCVERLHVAADRADRPAALHAAGGARVAVARAHHGCRADDGWRGGDRAAGAAAVPAAAALLRPGTAAGECERVKEVQPSPEAMPLEAMPPSEVTSSSEAMSPPEAMPSSEAMPPPKAMSSSQRTL